MILDPIFFVEETIRYSARRYLKGWKQETHSIVRKLAGAFFVDFGFGAQKTGGRCIVLSVSALGVNTVGTSY